MLTFSVGAGLFAICVESLDSTDNEQDGDGKMVEFDRFAIDDDELVDDTIITSRPTSFAALAT